MGKNEKLTDVFPPHQEASPLNSLDHVREISPHLDWLFRLHEGDKITIENGGFDDILAAAKSQLLDQLTAAKDDTELMAAIRHYRSRTNHLVAMTDFLNLVDVTTHLDWLSNTAEIALSATVDTLASDQDTQAQWFILALGKLGARELNYSSDIDLIVITLHGADDYDSAKKYVELTRKLTALMSKPTKDGLGWRVDLRLRPDPGATPVAIQHDAALSYYESLARTWERAAFIRARPVAGNIAAGQAFLDDIKPFIWRRYLDYTVLDDLKVMLRREARPDDLLGYNIKNGIGGIRAIEFFIHAQQLIAGGREPELRIPSTITALTQLANNDWITAETAMQLTDAYTIWRRLEHRLQMIGNAQTHQMPKSEQAFTDFAKFCGHDDPHHFRHTLIELGDQVMANTQGLLGRLSAGSTPTDDDTPLITDDLAASHERLNALGFKAPQTITSTCESWLAGRIPATRSPRSRDLMFKLLPRLLRQFAEHENPDAGFTAFAQLVERLPAGLQLFSLIDSQDDIAQMIVAIVSSAPTLSDQISRHPMLADALLYQSFWRPEERWADRENELKTRLSSLPYYEDQLSALRQQCREWQFRISALLLRGIISGDRAGADYTAIADAIIRCALPVVEREIKRRYGHVSGSGMAIYALGRCGAEEMTLTSDLDLLFVFDAPQEATSDGKRALMSPSYFVRFGQELINALSSLTAEGRCYEVDMRLRPSGNKGPVAVHIDGFERYQHHEAWTWEHMALIKNRYIGGINSAGIIQRMADLTSAIIKMPRPPDDLAQKVQEMRERINKARSPQSAHDLRDRDGGIMDIEFIIHMLQLHPAAKSLPVIRRSQDAIIALKDIGVLPSIEAETLLKTAREYTEIIQWMRLTGIRPKTADNPHTPLPPSVQKRFNIKNFGNLDEIIDEMAKPISLLVKKYVCKDQKKA
jgi:glutamate-ammonia-ligase adenylyltransferase